nr:MAG TPA: hypothetical protein [Caudoviricetes sp.]
MISLHFTALKKVVSKYFTNFFHKVVSNRHSPCPFSSPFYCTIAVLLYYCRFFI